MLLSKQPQSSHINDNTTTTIQYALCAIDEVLKELVPKAELNTEEIQLVFRSMRSLAQWPTFGHVSPDLWIPMIPKIASIAALAPQSSLGDILSIVSIFCKRYNMCEAL